MTNNQKINVMLKSKINVSAISAYPPSAKRRSRPRPGLGHLGAAAPSPEPPLWEEPPTPWEVAAPPDDTLTEMEGLARNPNATGAYAGSF